MTRAFLVVMAGGALLCSCSSDGDDSSDASLDGADGSELDAGLDAGDRDDADELGADDGDVEVETGADAEIDDEPLPPLQWGECDVSDWPLGYTLPPAGTECTSIEVPLDHDDPSGEMLILNVARQPSRSLPGSRAVFVLEGGPGGSSVYTSGLIPDAMPDLLDEFDLIYVDQRGTGGSGYLGCSIQPRSLSEWIYCAEEIEGTDLSHYLSVDVARDLDAVRARLGYEELSLFGVSYGTRIAFDYIRLYESRVVAAVLDGLAPPPVDLFSDSITSTGRGVDMLVQECEASPECLEVSPSLKEDLEQRLLTLTETPRTIVVSGETMLEDVSAYVSLLEAFIGASYWRYRVPRAVHLAVEGNNSAWNRLMSEAIGASVQDSVGTPARPTMELISARLPMDSWGAPFSSRVVNAAMLCAEILPNSDGVDVLNELHQEQRWPNESIVAKMNACSEWPVDPIPASQRQHIAADTDILLVSGAVDTNVDPAWAYEVEEAMHNATHIVVPYATHLPTYVPCVGRINAAFLAADGDLSSVDTSCLEEIVQPDWD